MTMAQFYPLASVLVLAALLLWPVSQLIWALSVNRLQRRLNRPLGESESRRQLRRAWLLGLLLTVPFSYLFHRAVLGIH